MRVGHMELKKQKKKNKKKKNEKRQVNISMGILESYDFQHSTDSPSYHLTIRIFLRWSLKYQLDFSNKNIFL